MNTPTILQLLVVAAFVCALLSIWKLPPWVAVLLLCIIVAIQVFPTK